MSVIKTKPKKMSASKRMKLINHVFNVMKRKDKGRAKSPAMTNKWGRIIYGGRKQIEITSPNKDKKKGK